MRRYDEILKKKHQERKENKKEKERQGKIRKED